MVSLTSDQAEQTRRVTEDGVAPPQRGACGIVE